MTDIVERLRDKLPMVHDGEGMIVDDDAVLDTLSKAADEIERLRTEAQELKLQYLSDQGQWIEETGRLRAALRKWDALIQYQYNGSREAMSALQECAFETDAILKGYALGEKE